MQEYELTVLIHPDRESELEKALTTVRDLVTTNGGKVVKEDKKTTGARRSWRTVLQGRTLPFTFLWT